MPEREGRGDRKVDGRVQTLPIVFAYSSAPSGAFFYAGVLSGAAVYMPVLRLTNEGGGIACLATVPVRCFGSSLRSR